MNILEATHISIAAKHDGELILYNQIVLADTTLIFTFNTSINFDLLNATHIQAHLNDTPLDTYFTNNDVSLRGSYIVNSGQFYVGYFSRE